jgi:oligoendopeptidase F
MADATLQCGLVLLAAGASVRMGRPKQLLEVDGEPLLRRAVQAALATPTRPVVVVLGAHAALIRPVVADLPVLLVENPDWAEGLGASLRTGVRALEAAAPGLDAMVVALADQPHFSAALVGRLLAEQARTGRAIVASRHGDRGGPPALFLRSRFDALRHARGDAGARALLASAAAEVALIDVPDAADLDTPDDYRQYAARNTTLNTTSSNLSASGSDIWDLRALYPTPEAWSAARERVAAGMTQIAGFRGRLGTEAATMRLVLDTVYDLRKELERLGVYAGLKADEDTRISEHQARRQVIAQLRSEFDRAVSWIDPEVLALGDDQVRAFLTQEPGLAPYRFDLENTLRQRPHTLGAEAEEVLSASGIVRDAPGEIYGILANADIPWPTITLGDGTSARLDQSGYEAHRSAPDREDRRRVFDAFWAAFKTYERTCGTALHAHVNGAVFHSRARRHPSALAAALAPDNIPVAVYRTLVAEVNTSLPTLHRYFRLRGRMLGVDRPRYYDIYPPLVQLDRRFTLAEAKALTLAAVRPLGPDYGVRLRAAFDARWMHVHPQPGKRSGAYMNGNAYDVHPYVLLNHHGDYESVSTFAHEWGHALHSLLSNAVQPYATAHYAIFTAEIASVVNEVLLFEHMLAQTADDDERLCYLGSALERLRATFYRQTMFAEFELAIHETVEGGGSLTGAQLTALYGDLLRRYHGHAPGVLLIDDAYTCEWAFVPHFYYNFYVYQYATAMAAANLFADRILAREPDAVDAFLGLLRAGGSDHPYQLVRDRGVDLATPAPYRSAASRMNAIMDRIEAILAQRGR